MKKKLLLIFSIVISVGVILSLEYYLVNRFVCEKRESEEKHTPQAMMLLIEFNNTDGLINMTNDMKERDIHGILMINTPFIKKNSAVIKEILKTGVIEIAPSYDPEPFWGMPYDQQYEIISEMINSSEEYLDITPRIISSRYMASDENTIKVAHDLGIEYVTARGTTELATTVYKPEEYDVKIISVSNIDVPEFKYGSFCDYSFYERNGSPEDMEKEYNRAIKEEKFMGVSHTYIGGYKERWNAMWHKFWDSYDVDWVDLDTIGSIDKTMPIWQIPINRNAPYTPEKIRPEIAYELEENITNPCKVEDLNEGESIITKEEEIQITVFHNNSDPMSLELIDFLGENDVEYEQHLTTDTDFVSQLNSYKASNSASEGISNSYEHYPIIFINKRAFSGFNKDIGDELLLILEK
ncbi:MAG: hypothetical protein WCR68_00635 [Candidatus Dojkabacteria bacterium]|jgi:hypothetical protein|nr:hypothetical protein [Candidatus Dojkabacteria bacterium]